jgi:hypothetical protein
MVCGILAALWNTDTDTQASGLRLERGSSVRLWEFRSAFGDRFVEVQDHAHHGGPCG